MIKEGNIKAIKNMSENQNRTSEYVDVMTFTDQNKEKYAITLYDSDEFWQDPTVIDYFPL